MEKHFFFLVELINGRHQLQIILKIVAIVLVIDPKHHVLLYDVLQAFILHQLAVHRLFLVFYLSFHD